MNANPERRLVIISNRLPVVIKKQGESWSVQPSSGGLVTAMAPVLRDRGGLWIGWPGTDEDADLSEPLSRGAKTAGYSLVPVTLTSEQRDKFYYGFSNEAIWPLFHDLLDRCNFMPDYWDAYLEVNRKFAEAIAEQTTPEDFIWVHDYHLMNVAQLLRETGMQARIGFFLHIPFPSPDIYMKLPWRFEILNGLLEYDLIGFQTYRDSRNFIQCIEMLIPDAQVSDEGRLSAITFGGRTLRVGPFPISIDYNSFEQDSVAREVADKAWFIHEDLPKREIILGVDRLDYTKGIPLRMEAFRNALIRYEELRQKRITLVQIVVPSREEIPEYQDLKSEVERLVGEINGQFTVSGWVPIIYISRNLDRQELLAYYRTSEIALITPLKDGMNLVAKEFCACSIEESAVLILSEFAGAAAELQNGAILVNPYNVESVADAIFKASTMPIDERKSRMGELRNQIRENTVFDWVESFLTAAIGKDLHDFPPVADYVPQPEG